MKIDLNKIYQHSPVFIQNLGVSYYGLKLYRREYGKKFRAMLEDFEKQQWYSHDELREYQNRLLMKLISHCYKNVPYYNQVMHDRKLKPEDIKSVDDLHKFPVLKRDTIKEQGASLLAKNINQKKLVVGFTSGTIGVPMKLVWDERVCLVKNVVDWRQKGVAGIRPGDRMAFLYASTVVPLNRRKPPFWRYNWILNHLHFSNYHLLDNVEHYVDKLAEFKPKAIEGYPSLLYVIARFLQSNKRIIPVKAVFTSSETLMQHQRESIEAAFDCKIYDFYGLAERDVFATECEYHQGKHLNEDFGITEIMVNGERPAEAGEMGRIVATGLHNYAMPLIRYETTDITMMASSKCPCGRSFPLMENVTARDQDFLLTDDGRHISPYIVVGITRRFTNIQEHQFIQEDRDLVRIKIIKTPEYTEEDSKS
ncbi:MAG: hypothetical protein GWN00_23680, partial [Aliifodinibius sp.]|nr:phenylacetate--CoA ligase family protein [Fodinibius sp.]NIY27695.1 hypothetical protein [Fodinibius sp.]